MNKIRKIFYKIKNKEYKGTISQLNWIYQYARPHILKIVIYTILGLSGSLIGIISSLVSRDLVDIITGHKTGELLFTFFAMFAIALLGTVVGQLSSLLSTQISMKVENSIKAEAFDRIIESQWEELSQYNSGTLISCWSGDVSIVSNGILTLFPNLVIFVFQFISALYMVLRYDASFAVFAIVSVPLSLLISKESMKRLSKNNQSMFEINTKLANFNHEVFGNIQIVKAFDTLPMYSKRLKLLQKEYVQQKLKWQKISIFNSIMLTILSMLVSYAAQGWGIYKVWSGAITYGTMTMFISLSSTLSGTANNLIAFFPQAVMLANSSKRLRNIMSLPKEDFSQRDKVKEFYDEHREEGIGIHVSGIDFAYKGGDTVLTDSAFDAYPRETIAFVGPSGEGKTTMLRYILRLINPEHGSGYICAGRTLPGDGQCLELSASVRQIMAYVPQGNTMFAGTIAENMRNVKEDATDEEIIDALRMACAWRFVEKLPDGINSVIRERGTGFSEGQAQRLSIARALLRKSPILLLDEATSALDPATERELLNNIMSDNYARTCIVTTHRPKVLSVCNRVYAVHDKRVDMLTEDEVKDLIEK